MKNTLIAVAALALFVQNLAAQNEDWLKKYERQINAVGLSGPGVETILDKWGQADSTSSDYLKARYAFWYDKSHSTKVESSYNPKYLGLEPLFNLRDTSANRTVWYYQVDDFDDELLGRALSCLDKAAASSPDDLELRLCKITSLMLYEKESPDMTLSGILGLVDENHKLHPAWKWQGETVDEEFFNGLIQEFC